MHRPSIRFVERLGDAVDAAVTSAAGAAAA
jgi:hypothetical protein